MAKVYFLILHDPAHPEQDLERVKVGVTSGDVARRIAQLQTGNPWELRCVDAFETPCARRVEHFVHRTHAEAMQHLEWLRCPRGDVRALVDEAKLGARRLEERSSRERALATRPSNGVVRRPRAEDLALHAEARRVKTKLVPAELKRVTAEARLSAATGGTLGIPGIVRVQRVDATTRFSKALAEARFPELADRCRTEKVTGKFCWLKTQGPRHFGAASVTAREALGAAEAAAAVEIEAGGRLQGLTPRTAEHEALHDEFLKATQAVTNLVADLADLQSELAVRLGEDEEILGICSFKRHTRARIDAARFCRSFPAEALQCEELVPPQLRKRVYPTRSYW